MSGVERPCGYTEERRERIESLVDEWINQEQGVVGYYRVVPNAATQQCVEFVHAKYRERYGLASSLLLMLFGNLVSLIVQRYLERMLGWGCRDCQ